MKKLLPLGLLLLLGCEQAATSDVQPAAAAAAARASVSVDSYMRGFALYDQCIWGYGACAVAVTEANSPEATGRTSSAPSRIPRVRLTLSPSRLHVQFLTPYDPDVKRITIRPGEEFFVAQPETDALGAHAIKVKSGTYPVDTNWGEHGGVRFNVQVY
ncbi:hypothetical protein KLP40_10695 [Hymenobacter sp. NST-14]|uniref:hypothetical protein n=1 Tax=Hymenobacter piscis TaxID=2839984 RepID=UPI001C017236|nr:hypothetical protein [Hymenobacter piscis]MBT9393630.1 hypothetical protein [Hymenobacter piscis]